jgi:hypothetical protein
MRKWAVSTLAAILASVAFTAAGRTSWERAGPPSGLTSYGRIVWNLDALLHDSFGRRAVYLNRPRDFPRSPRNFSTTFRGDCCSVSYVYTFADARGSALSTLRPATPPRPEVGGAGAEMPLTIRGAYISCGRGRWLFEHLRFGSGPANWRLSCHA